MKLYYSKGACSLAVRIILHELGIFSQYEAVDLRTKKTETGADFLQINPKGAVPVLVLDNGDVLTENSAIQQYLADNYHGDKLLPAVGEMQRYRVLEWLNFVSTELHKGFSPIFNPAVSDEMKKNVFIPNIKNKLAYVNQALGDRNYLVGDQFTLPDAYLVVVLMWMGYPKIDLAEFPEVDRYFRALNRRESVLISLKEEGI